MKNNSPLSLNERGASSWDLVLKILSITLVALFAFSSGVWFGKKLSDSDHQRMALEGEFDKEVRKTASVDEHADGALDDKEALSDEEVAAAADKALEAGKAKPAEGEAAGEAVAAHGEEHAAPAKDAHAAPSKEVAKETSKETPKEAKEVAAKEAKDSHAAHAPAPEKATRAVASAKEAAKEPAKESGKPDLSAAHQAAVRVANNAAPVAKEQPPAPSRVPTSLPKTVGASNDVEFTVQIASYPTAEAAKEHVDAMVKKGFPAFPVEAKVNGKTWYRVSVGSFKSFNDASKFRAQLLKQADLPSAIVQKVTR